MVSAWFSFSIVIGIQLVLFFIHAWYEGRLRDVPYMLALGCAIGVVFGIPFDLIVGHYFGLYTYVLGFTFPFLFWNGLLSFGFMQANVLLMEKVGLIHFLLWSMLVGVVYEVTNYLFPVWEWEFGPIWFEYLAVVCVLYAGLAGLMAVVWNLLFRHKFMIITNALKFVRKI